MTDRPVEPKFSFLEALTNLAAIRDYAAWRRNEGQEEDAVLSYAHEALERAVVEAAKEDEEGFDAACASLQMSRRMEGEF